MHHWLLVLVPALAFALGGCAAGVTKPRETAARQAAPVSFAGALARGLPVAVGVYGVGPESAAAPAPLRSADRGDMPPWSNFDPRSRVGAGFFISADGLIATAAHVVADSARIVVKLADERVFTAERVAVDDDADIALIKVAATLPQPLPLGNSATLRPGDWVLAVGEPYGLDRSVVAGIVGGRDRHFAEDGALLFIQSDLSLNPGNSGGPLLDVHGSVVGMNLRTVVGPYGSPGLSLSMPIEVVQQIAGELASHGRITRPRLGAAFEDVSPFAALAAGRTVARGALISSVATNGLAERIGLHRSDIVIGMNGQPVSDSADLARVLLDWRQASGTRITVFRDGRYRQLAIP